jgi:ArsR family transcriptional regulator, arsenate/arsenite/antimonite-responsive transcriptional repressor
MFKYTSINLASQEAVRAPTTQVTELAAVLKVLSDPTRLRILSLLLARTHCNCEIAASLDISLSLVSHHMRILRLIGLVSGVRDPQDERWVYYSVNRLAVQNLEAGLQVILHPTEAHTDADQTECCAGTRI